MNTKKMRSEILKNLKIPWTSQKTYVFAYISYVVHILGPEPISRPICFILFSYFLGLPFVFLLHGLQLTNLTCLASFAS